MLYKVLEKISVYTRKTGNIAGELDPGDIIDIEPNVPYFNGVRSAFIEYKGVRCIVWINLLKGDIAVPLSAKEILLRKNNLR